MYFVGCLHLKTIAGLSECWVKLSADGFEASEQKKIQLVDKQTITASLTFDNTSKRTVSTNTQQKWTENNITFTNDKANATQNVQTDHKPIRLRANSKVIVSVPSGGVITKIVFDCSNSTYATALKNSIGNSATSSQDKVTVTLNDASNEYVINKLTEQVRLDAITVTYDK